MKQKKILQETDQRIQETKNEYSKKLFNAQKDKKKAEEHAKILIQKTKEKAQEVINKNKEADKKWKILQ